MIEGLLPFPDEIPHILLFYIPATETHSGSIRATLPFHGGIRHLFFSGSCAFHYLHPLPEIQYMRRCIDSGLQSGRSQYGGQHAAHRAFSVGPGHMHSHIFPVRMPVQLVKEFHIGYPGLIGRLSVFLE